MKRLQSNKGFTLIEMILSVGLLALLSVGILRLFIAAQVNHDKAVDLDHAVWESGTLIEETRQREDIPSGGSHFTLYYDENWSQTLDETRGQYAVYGDVIPLSEKDQRLFNLHLKFVRIIPYPLESKTETVIYLVSDAFRKNSGEDLP